MTLLILNLYTSNFKKKPWKKFCSYFNGFSENYAFYVQDEVQGHHWTHHNCTVHPVVCYYKNSENEPQHANLCFLFDELQHDVVMVHQIQVHTIQYLKSFMPNLNIFIKMNIMNIKMVEYFSDDCAAQYKNRKSFLNLCKHQEDFGVEAVWSFFATSHGKSPCDGIGGTVKRSTALVSLRHPLENQILDVDSMMSYCKSAIPKIRFVKILEDDLNRAKAVLEPRFQKLSPIKGTRTFHYFKPLTTP